MRMHNSRPAEWCIIVGHYTQRHHHPTDVSTSDRSASPGILLEAVCRLWPFPEVVPPVRNVGLHRLTNIKSSLCREQGETLKPICYSLRERPLCPEMPSEE